jgi:SulP family sulfate permease
LKTSDWLTALLAGLVVGVVVVIVAISFAVLIFSGDLAPIAPKGISLGLFTAVVMAGLIALTSSYRGMVATPQDVPAAITALVASSVAATLPAGTSSDALFATVVAAIALITVSTGLFFLALGFFKLGGLSRFIPYPVIGGFLAGTGWLLFRGSVGVLSDVPLSFDTLSRLLDTEIVVRWLPGFVFGLVLLVILRRTSHFLALPVLLVGGIGIFFILLAVTGTSIAEATARGWLFEPLPAGDLWRPLDPALLAQVSWKSVLAEAPSLLAIMLAGMVALLLNATGLELVVEREIDLDRELRAAGAANILAGLGGGMVGFQTLALSALGHRIAPDRRLVGIVSAGLCATCLFFGSTLLTLFPKPILGGLLLFLGLAFLVEWVWDAWFKLPRFDYLVVVSILAAIATVGFLEGVGLGVAIAVVLFVVNYSRIDVVKIALSGATYTSKVQRPPKHARALRVHGHELFILQLQGFLFFGTANQLVERVRQRMGEAGLPAVRYLLLDFRLVSGIDSSALLGFVKMHKLAESQAAGLVFVHTPPEVQRQLERNGICDGDGVVVRWFPELDRAVEWCEDQILLARNMALEERDQPLAERLARMLVSDEAPKLIHYLERIEVPEGHLLIRQDDPADDVYLVESGRVTAQMELAAGKTVRLLTMGAGSIVGQEELYLGTSRAASVVTEAPSVIYRLSAGALHRMESDEPSLAIALHHFMSRILTERLAVSQRTLQSLTR